MRDRDEPRESSCWPPHEITNDVAEDDVLLAVNGTGQLLRSGGGVKQGFECDLLSIEPRSPTFCRSTGSIVALTGVRISKKTARRSTVSVIVRWLDLAHGTVVAGATYPVSIRFTYHSTSRSRAVEGVNSGRFTPSTAYVATASSCKRSTIDPEDPLFLDVVYRRQIRRAAMAISAHPLEKFRRA